MSKFRKVVTLFDDYYEMMSDAVRMEAYRKAVMSVVKEGDTVLDLGSGPGILGFFAIRAGASKVYAIEKSDSVNLASNVARLNGFENKIEFINKNSKDTVLEEKVDVIVSETLGSFAIDENTLDFTIDARERFLKPGGLLIPDRIRLWVAPVENYRIYKKMSFWKDIYGIDFSPAMHEMTKRLMIDDVAGEDFLSDPLLLKEIDLYGVNSPVVEENLTFTFKGKGTVHGLGGWFEVVLSDNFVINTSPLSKPTHWKHSFFPLKNPVNIIKDDIMNLKMRIGPKDENEDGVSIDYDCFFSQKANEIKGRVGRNELCPCGSGKKYKKCCMN